MQINAQLLLKSNMWGSAKFVPAAFFTGRNKRPIYREIKSHNNHKPLSQPAITAIPLPRRQQTWPNTPSLYLEPPKLIKYEKNDKLIKTLKKNSNSSGNGKNKLPTNQQAYIRDHAPMQEYQETTDAQVKNRNNIEESTEDKNAVQFHVHGHQGPNSYVFGYDTGKG